MPPFIGSNRAPASSSATSPTASPTLTAVYLIIGATTSSPMPLATTPISARPSADYLDYPGDKHPGMKQFWERPFAPLPRHRHPLQPPFPEEFQDNFLNCNVIGFQGIYRVKVREEGSGIWGETINPPLISSDDPNFRPITPWTWRRMAPSTFSTGTTRSSATCSIICAIQAATTPMAEFIG